MSFRFNSIPIPSRKYAFCQTPSYRFRQTICHQSIFQHRPYCLLKVVLVIRVDPCVPLYGQLPLCTATSPLISSLFKPSIVFYSLYFKYFCPLKVSFRNLTIAFVSPFANNSKVTLGNPIPPSKVLLPMYFKLAVN